MPRQLSHSRQGPDLGSAKQAVVFLHGYGADGADLLGLAAPMAPHLPDTAFLAPNAPEPCTGNPMGYQWFPIPWLDGSSEAEAAAGLNAAAEDLNAYLDQVLETEGLEAEDLAVIGFSQGTMMSLHVAPRREAPIAAIVGFSGRLIAPERLAQEAVSKMPVLLLHGDQDDVVPYDSMKAAGDALAGAGFQVFGFTMYGTAHGIAPEGLGQSVSFLRQVFGFETGPEEDEDDATADPSSEG